MKQSKYGRRVLITGVTGGIGLATARLFLSRGFQVAGCSRHPIDALPEELCWFPMDVSSDESVAWCVRQAEAALDGIDILIHCAGMGLAGAVEDVSALELGRQLDINTLGFVRVVQAVLPGMRTRGRGLVLPISSVAGFIAIPYQSSYSASKFALEALVQAMRLEVRPMGVQTCLIEPGDTRTSFTTARKLCRRVSPCYESSMRAAVHKMELDEQNGKSPETVARVALKLAGRARPPVRCAVGASYRCVRFLFKCLPDRLATWIVGKLYLPAHPDSDISLVAKP